MSRRRLTKVVSMQTPLAKMICFLLETVCLVIGWPATIKLLSSMEDLGKQIRSW